MTRDRTADWVQEPLAVAGWNFPEYLKRAKLSQEEIAKEVNLDLSQLRNYMYRRTIPLALYKRTTFKRGLLGMSKPEVVQMKAPFRMPKSYRAWVGDAALNFDKLKADAEAETNGRKKGTPLTRATPEQRREWMARAAVTRRQRREERERHATAQPELSVVPVTEPTPEPSAPSFSTPPTPAAPPQLSEMWTQVYVSTLGYMTQQVAQQAVEIERLRQQVAEQRAARQRVERLHQDLHTEYVKLQQDLETAEQLMGERVAVVADAPPEAVAAVQAAIAAATRTGSQTPEQAVQDAMTRLRNGSDPIFDGLARRVDSVAQVEGELPK